MPQKVNPKTRRDGLTKLRVAEMMGRQPLWSDQSEHENAIDDSAEGQIQRKPPPDRRPGNSDQQVGLSSWDRTGLGAARHGTAA
ncbi:hypothetical protein CSOJ01_00744 [Colletotrichum sojae]|uniref:Uncharacterized protein n=1 Tax=Colletotrichum sojae TaxID=2175907 RepID=A0A8H6N5L4_9PEZI|nr:hypothetical protein CSOJ01_00744 [Colletotrichum sojae]